MKLLISIIAVFTMMLVGCSGNQNVKLEATKSLYTSTDKETPFEIKVSEDGKAIKGLEISAKISMVNMDHGSMDVTFAEEKSGLYTTNVKLPMTGEYEFVYSIERDGKTFEKVEKYKAKKKTGVATINGELITSEDISFYRFINQLHIAISRSDDEKNLSGQELEQSKAYWDSQEKLNENQSQLLTQIIRLRAMALLGEEKGHKATAEEVDAALDAVRAQYSQHQVATDMIQAYGEDKFWSIEKKQYELIVLSQKVQQDLIDKVKKENPKVNDQEISYLAQKEYEDLLVSQVNSLKIDIL